MHIGISTLVTPPVVSGVGNYLTSLVQALQRIDTVNQYSLYVTPETAHLFPVSNPHFKHCVLPLKHDPRWLMRPAYFLWQNSLFNLEVRLRGIDVFHVPNLVPFFYSAVPRVITIHDLAEFYIQRYRSCFRQAYRRWLTKAVTPRADAVICVSENTKCDLVNFCRIDAEQVYVTYEALPWGFHADKGSAVSTGILERLGVQKGNYFIYVGNDLPHKRLGVLLQAFSLIKRDGYEHKLVLVGNIDAEMLIHANTNEGSQGFSHDVVFPGYLDQREITELYKEATAFVFPSAYEGFGLPLIEAMSNGCPVLCGTNSCLPEIAGSAAVFVEPVDAVTCYQCMKTIIQDGALRRRLALAGIERANMFSWEKCANETLQVYDKVCASTREK